MAKDKKLPELVDIVADALGYDIVNREEFTMRVNQILIDFIAPRLYTTELHRLDIISPKKAPSDARGTREVAK